MIPYPTPDALWMITLSFGHSTMYVPIRHLIQYMGSMALMPKICKKNSIYFCGLLWFLGPLVPGYEPISHSRHPMNDYFIFGTFHNVCTNEKSDLM